MRLIILTILLCTSFLGISQEHKLEIIETGNNSANYSFLGVQGSKGYMWFATSAGLIKYDGNKLSLHKHDASQQNNVLFQLCEDHMGNIWAGSYGGNIYRFNDDSLHLYQYQDSITKYAPKKPIITEIHVDENATLSIRYRNHGVLSINASGTVSTFKSDKNLFGSLKLEKNLNVYTIDDSLFIDLKLNGSPASFARQTPLSIIRFGRYVSIGNQNLLAFDNDLFLCNENEPTRIHSFEKEVTWISEAHLPNHFWVGFYHNGASLYKLIGNQVVLVEEVIKDYSVTSVAQDFEGGIWFTTMNGKMLYLRDFGIQHYTFDSRQINRLAAYGDKFLATTPIGHIYEIDPSTGDYRSIYSQEKVAQKSLQRFQDDVFVGPFQINIKTGEKKRVFEKISDRHQFSSSCITSDGTIYYGDANGVHKCVPNTLNEYRKSDVLVRCIYSDSQDRIWVGLVDGLYQYKNNKLVRIIEEEDVEGICEWKGGLVYGTYKKGLFFLEENSTDPISLNAINNNISIDHVGRFLSTKDTLWVAFKHSLQYLTQSQSEGLNVTTVTSYLSNGNFVFDGLVLRNKIYFPSKEGLVSINQNYYHESTVPPRCHIKSITANGIQILNKATLRPDQHNIKVTFEGVSFRSSKLLYKYRLKGTDKEWQESEVGMVNLSNLSSGSYILEVKAINDAGIESEVQTVTFTIKEHFSEKWWFLSLSFGAFLIVFSAIVIWRMRKVKEKALLRIEIDRMRIQCLVSQLNPHFIFNSLGSIQAYIVQNEKKMANKFVNQFARLMRRILEMSAKEYVSLEDELNFIGAYLDLEKIRLEDKFEYAFDIDAQIDQGRTEIPTFILQPFLENAIWHGFVKDRTDYQLKVSLQKISNKSIRILISDNGEGMNTTANKEHQSFSMNAIKSRLNLLSKEKKQTFSLEILESNKGQGITVQIIAPIQLKS